MANLTHTLCDEGAIDIDDAEFRDETLTFPGADTYVKGTILARREVNLTPVAAAVGGNTGTGTVTALSVVTGPEVPLVGAYSLVCIAAAAHGGTFKLLDPNGRVVAGNLIMTAGSGAATVMKAGGLQFTVTDATDFVVGDSFTITVAADGKLVVYSPTGAGGVQVPCAVLTYEVVKTGSGDVVIRPLIAGKVNKKRLVIDADGDDSNVTNHVIDLLRARSIIAVDVKQLSGYDNQ
jgi:hypothetical protein